MTPETRRKLSEKLKGRIFSKTHRRRISKAKRAVGAWRGKNNPKFGKGYELRGENNPMWGRHRTDEEKTHLSMCNSRPVAVFKNGVLFKMFHSVSETEKYFGIHCVGSMITGKRHNPTEYVFKHITMEEFEHVQ